MTQREELRELLKARPHSAQELANKFCVEMVVILDHIQHIRRSIRPLRLKIVPAQCKSCGFSFDERSKVKKPSKCPRCRGERIEPQLFGIPNE